FVYSEQRAPAGYSPAGRSARPRAHRAGPARAAAAGAGGLRAAGIAGPRRFTETDGIVSVIRSHRPGPDRNHEHKVRAMTTAGSAGLGSAMTAHPGQPGT